MRLHGFISCGGARSRILPRISQEVPRGSQRPPRGAQGSPRDFEAPQGPSKGPPQDLPCNPSPPFRPHPLSQRKKPRRTFPGAPRTFPRPYGDPISSLFSTLPAGRPIHGVERHRYPGTTLDGTPWLTARLRATPAAPSVPTTAPPPPHHHHHRLFAPLPAGRAIPGVVPPVPRNHS